MTDLPMQFPVLALRRPIFHTEGEPEHEDIEVFEHEGLLKHIDRWLAKKKDLVGALFVDATGRSWRVLDMVDLGAGGRSWRKILNIIFRTNRLIRYELREEERIPFETLRDRVCASIQANPDTWRDDEAIAGEDGPPRDEQEMLDELTERVRKTTDFHKMIKVLDSPHG